MGITVSTLTPKEMLSFYVLVSSIILAEIPSSVESVPAPVPEGNRNRTSVTLPIQAFQPCFDTCKAIDFNGEISCDPIPAPIKCDNVFPSHSFPPKSKLRKLPPYITVETDCCIVVIVISKNERNVMVENSDKN